MKYTAMVHANLYFQEGIVVASKTDLMKNIILLASCSMVQPLLVTVS